MKPRHRRSAAGLHDLEFANDRISIGDLRQPENAVGNGEYRIALLAIGILADEKGCDFPRGQMEREPLHEMVDRHLAIREGLDARERAKGIDHHNPRLGAFDLPYYSLEHDAEILSERFLAQVQVLHGRTDERAIEERVLAHVSQHLQRGLAKDREIKRRALRRRVGEHDLLREGRFPRAGVAGNQVERVFGEATTQDRIETGHAGRHASNRRCMSGWFRWSRFARSWLPSLRHDDVSS